MKLRKLVESINALNQLISTDLPVGLSFKVARNQNKFNKELEEYQAEHRKLLEKHYKEDKENKNQMKAKSEKDAKEFTDTLNKILDTDVSVSLDPIKYSDFEAQLENKDIKIKPSTLAQLMFLFEE